MEFPNISKDWETHKVVGAQNNFTFLMSIAVHLSLS